MFFDIYRILNDEISKQKDILSNGVNDWGAYRYHTGRTHATQHVIELIKNLEENLKKLDDI